MDNIVSRARSFYQYIIDLRELFQVFTSVNVSISPTKTFLGYPDINLLGQRVNSFRLLTALEKLKAISLLTYPSTVGNLTLPRPYRVFAQLCLYVRPKGKKLTRVKNVDTVLYKVTPAGLSPPALDFVNLHYWERCLLTPYKRPLHNLPC